MDYLKCGNPHFDDLLVWSNRRQKIDNIFAIVTLFNRILNTLEQKDFSFPNINISGETNGSEREYVLTYTCEHKSKCTKVTQCIESPNE